VITDFFQNLALSFLDWLISLMPVFSDASGVVVTASNFLSTLVVAGASLGVWIPWQTVGICAGLVSSAYVTFLTFKAARALLAHVPFVGGAG
jgi:hypothetical protein